MAECTLALAVLSVVGLGTASLGQTREEPASSPKLAEASKELKWEVPTTPTKVVGPIYYVGTTGLSSWLITTPRGHILLNTGLPSSGRMIAESIRQLGFRPEDIRVIIIGHAHIDHVGAVAELQKLSGAGVLAMEQEADLLQSGGTTDYLYGQEPEFGFAPVKPARIVRDGDRIAYGDVTLTARLTPGHTRGTTTWTTRVMDGGKTYNVVFADGTTVSPGTRLAGKPSYPEIEADYRRTFGVLEDLKPDIWLAAHPELFGFEAKRARAPTEGAQAFVDPKGYASWVAAARKKFEAQLAADRAAAAKK
jgi:metallo-beta-lactamase class B